MIKKTILIISILTVALLVGAFAVYAYTSWNQTVNWSDQDLNFDVYSTPTSTSPIQIPSTLNLIVIPTSIIDIDYYIENEGNVEIRVTGSVSSSGTVTAIWSPVFVDVTVGSRELITLTLSGFGTGGGSLTVSFTSEKKI